MSPVRFPAHALEDPSCFSQEGYPTPKTDSLMQRAQDFPAWSFPHSYGHPDYAFSMADEDPFAPRTSYPCDPRIIFNQNLDYEYPADHEPQHFSRLSISHSPAPEYTSSQASSRYPSPSLQYHNDAKPEPDEMGSDEPYAKLIYRALLHAPNHAMVLKDIYKWFEEHTDKAESPSKGWQNSIRHNLSMNGAFKKHEREPSTEDGKKYCEWVLEPSAIAEGVKSTTRYRKPTNHKARHRADPPAPIRQYSGRLGGQANRQQSQKRKWMERADRDLLGRPERFVGTERDGASAYAGPPPNAQGLLYHPQPQYHPLGMAAGGADHNKSHVPHYPPTPLPDYDPHESAARQRRCLRRRSSTPTPLAGPHLDPFYYPAPSGEGVAGLYGLGDEEEAGADMHVFDGLPTPEECVAALGQCVGVCGGGSPVFADLEEDLEEGAGGDGKVCGGEGGSGVGAGSGVVGAEEEGKGPLHCPRMWEEQHWHFFGDE